MCPYVRCVRISVLPGNSLPKSARIRFIALQKVKNRNDIKLMHRWDWNTDTTDIRTQTDTLVSLLCPYFSHWYCVESNGVRNSDCLKYGHSSEGLKYGHIKDCLKYGHIRDGLKYGHYLRFQTIGWYQPPNWNSFTKMALLLWNHIRDKLKKFRNSRKIFVKFDEITICVVNNQYEQ